MNVQDTPEGGPHYSGGGNDSMAALSQVSGGNHTYPGVGSSSSHDQLNDREASLSYGYNYTPTGTPTHSYSTADRNSEQPSLVRDSTARASARKAGKLFPFKVQMLDDSVVTLPLPHGCLGVDLFKECCRYLNLLEMDYFGMEYFNKTDKVVWLDLEKPIERQVAAPKKTLFHFTVKFYLADPGQLHDEFSKYLYALQIKKDLANGRLPCSENTAALMASYMLQAEVGDYCPSEHDDGRYITAFRFVPNQTKAMESKIQEYHKNHIGQTPADADFNLLDVARRLEMYGVQLHLARDYENVQLHLAVSHQGVLVFHSNSRINTFSWAKIRKLSFKRKRFLVKLHPEGFGYPRSTVEFLMATRNECKRFWKCCVEHHTFFRLTQPRHGRRPRRRLMSRGSTFRYSGRTQKQVVEDARVTYIQRPGFGPSVARVSTRSLGAPRTTTPLTVNITESAVPDHHSAPDLTYGESYANGQEDVNATGSPTSVSPTTPSSTPVTPIHDNSRIAIHKGQSNSSITYEYTVNEEAPQTQSPDFNQHPEIHNHMAVSVPADVLAAEERKPEQLEPRQEEEEAEPWSPIVNGDHSGHEGLNSPILSPAGTRTMAAFSSGEEQAPEVSTEEESVIRKKRHPPDRAYFIAKEILTTERTYLKDLEVVVVWFRKSTTNEIALPDILETLFTSLDPIYEFHCKFLKEIETRLTSWEERTSSLQKGNFQRVGDVILKNVQHLKLYQGYVEKLNGILQELEVGKKKNKKFEIFYKDFELQKVCYLPFNTFLLKPMQRLLHYQLILERLIKHYPSDHPDYKDCKAAVSEVNELTAVVNDNMKTVENYLKLAELQRDLVGFDSLLIPGRHFIREGCLHKLSRKGYQQRMFFLFSDILVYTSKGLTPTNQFKVHGQIPLKGIVLEDSDHNRTVANSLTLYGTNKMVVIAASTPEEKERWMGDLRTAMGLASNNPNSPESNSTLSDPESSTHEESEEDIASPTKSLDRQMPSRANTTVHVCWHRNTSVSMADHMRALENQLSGFLLRKFKNSNGWQKLWVVFTNFCLFFYKSHQEDYPLASLPLLGYSVLFPTEEDDIRKDYVFKLQFKTHVYFFRAESEYTFSRWLEVLKSATFSSKVESLF